MQNRNMVKDPDPAGQVFKDITKAGDELRDSKIPVEERSHFRETQVVVLAKLLVEKVGLVENHKNLNWAEGFVRRELGG